MEDAPWKMVAVGSGSCGGDVLRFAAPHSNPSNMVLDKLHSGIQFGLPRQPASLDVKSSGEWSPSTLR